MKELRFNCLQARLYNWAREQLPAGVNIDDKSVAEVLFKTLFPASDNYRQRGGECFIGESASPRRCAVTVRTNSHFLRNSSERVGYVTLENNAGGIDSAVETLRAFGLLDGDAEIAARAADIDVDHKAAIEAGHKAEGKTIVGVFGFLVLYLIAFVCVISLVLWLAMRFFG